MPTLSAFSPPSPLPPLIPGRPHLSSSSSSLLFFSQKQRTRVSAAASPPRSVRLVVASSAPSFDELHHHARGRSRSNPPKNSILSNLIQEIEPLDVSIIQKDVPAETVDAMKRTISSMLGLLPSDQFHVHVDALWKPLSKLLVSSMMTGYTLRNAEFRLCLEKNLDIYDDERSESQELENADYSRHRMLPDGTAIVSKFSGKNDLSLKSEESVEEQYCDDMKIQDLGEMTPEVQDYILHLQTQLSSVKQELHEIKRKNSALQMQHFVGEEKNDLLDYLRSLKPEKVAELSEPACPELQETIHSIVHGLLATLSPKMHSRAPSQSENASTGISNIGKDDYEELVENTSLHFQPLISVSRDYLARLLFWCMLLGHYIRGLEYRLELTQLLTLSGNAESIAPNDESIT